MARRERYLDERARENGLLYYDSFDNEYILLETIDSEQVTPSLSQAQRMRKRSEA